MTDAQPKPLSNPRPTLPKSGRTGPVGRAGGVVEIRALHVPAGRGKPVEAAGYFNDMEVGSVRGGGP